MKIQPDGVFEFTKPELCALLAFAYTDEPTTDIGNPLASALLDPSGGRVVVTDGHVLLVGQCEPEEKQVGKPKNLRIELLERGVRLLRKKADTLKLRANCDKGEAWLSGGKLTAPSPEKAFPLYEGVMTKARKAAPEVDAYDDKPKRQKQQEAHDKACDAVPVIGVSAELLARLELVRKACQTDPHSAVAARLSLPQDELDPIRADFQTLTNPTRWTALIMPMRLADEDHQRACGK